MRAFTSWGSFRCSRKADESISCTADESLFGPHDAADAILPLLSAPRRQVTRQAIPSGATILILILILHLLGRGELDGTVQQDQGRVTLP